jgi:hypothetical protein
MEDLIGRLAGTTLGVARLMRYVCRWHHARGMW